MTDLLADTLRAEIQQKQERLARLQKIPANDPHTDGTVLRWRAENYWRASVRLSGRWLHTGLTNGTYERWIDFRSAYLANATEIEVLTDGRPEGRPAVVVVGQLAEGFDVVGPFATLDEAGEYADGCHDPVWVTEVTAPGEAD